MPSVNDDAARELERLAEVIVPYLCERTGLSRMQVEGFLDAQEAFWDSQPTVIGQMFIFGFPTIEDEDEGSVGG